MINVVQQYVGSQGRIAEETSSTLPKIESLVAAGFAIHRLHKKSKAPVGKDWSEKPVLSFERLSRLYKEGENVGVRLGKWSKVGGGFLHVIDLDIRDPGKADAARARLTELFPEWTSFPTVISGSGGESRHLYLITDKPFPSKKLAHSDEKIIGADGKKHWAWEIELFGTGKQVAMPPSIHPDTGKPYRWLREFEFDDLDLGLGPYIRSERIGEIVEAEEPGEIVDDERTKPLGLSDQEIRDVLATIPAATYCDDRDGWLAVGMALHHETGGSDKGFEFWCEFSKRSDKFDARDQKRVWRSFKGKAKPLRMGTLVSAARDAQMDAEFDNLEDDFDDLGDEDDTSAGDDQFDDLLGDGPAAEPKVSKRQEKLNKAKVEAELGHVPPKVARINRSHAVAFINGKTVILTENEEGGVSYGTVGDLHNFYENDRVATDKSTVPVTKWWMQHKKRRQYRRGVVFAPGEVVEGAYNHWRGFAVEPDRKASCRLFLKHVRKIICKDDEAAYNYLMGWLAHMIQKPWEKPGTMVVLRGLKGTGKDIVGEYVGGLFPNHHVKIASQEHMTGRFNAHQEKTLLLHVEEAFWAGNKAAESTLKHLVTSEKVLIEPKGLNAFSVKSVLRLFMSSNEKWVVPATEDERRYFVLDVSDRYSMKKSTPAERKAYFVDGILNEMRNGGREALLHLLQTYDLSNFDVRDVPNTAALADQKIQGLKNIERWWFGMLQTGDAEFATSDEKGRGEGDWWREGISVDKTEFREAYSKWMRARRFDGEELRDFEIGKHLANMMPEIVVTRPRVNGSRVRSYKFPVLRNCRVSFEAWLGSEVLWEGLGDYADREPVDDLD